MNDFRGERQDANAASKA